MDYVVISIPAAGNKWLVVPGRAHQNLETTSRCASLALSYWTTFETRARLLREILRSPTQMLTLATLKELPLQAQSTPEPFSSTFDELHQTMSATVT
jgi:hypothetical protein